MAATDGLLSRLMSAARYVSKLLGQFLKAWQATDCPPAIPQYRSIPSCNRLPSEDLMYCGCDLIAQATCSLETTKSEHIKLDRRRFTTCFKKRSGLRRNHCGSKRLFDLVLRI